MSNYRMTPSSSAFAIDIRDNATGTVGRHDCGGLFVFIGADAETDWLPAEIAYPADIQQFARRAVGFGGVEADLAAKSNHAGDLNFGGF